MDTLNKYWAGEITVDWMIGRLGLSLWQDSRQLCYQCLRQQEALRAEMLQHAHMQHQNGTCRAESAS